MTREKNLLAQLDSVEIDEIVKDAESDDWDLVKCCICGRPVKIWDAINLAGDPACRRCA